MTNYIFKEVSPNVVAHTAASKVLSEDPKINDWAGFCLEDAWIVSPLFLFGRENCSNGTLPLVYLHAYIL